MDRSSMWMPVAVIGPAGASFSDMRQLSAAMARNLSWLKLASICSSVPSSPARARRCSSSSGGSKRRSWPTASATPFARQASIARAASARVSDSGFSQNTCFFAAAARTICPQCSECGVQRITPSMFGLFIVFSKLLENSRPFSRQKPSPAPDARSTPTTAFSLSLPFSKPTMIRPHHPRPTTATLSIYSVGLATSPPSAARPQAENCASVLKLKCAAERVRIAEDALDRVAVVDAVGARHRVQDIHRFGARSAPHRRGPA